MATDRIRRLIAGGTVMLFVLMMPCLASAVSTYGRGNYGNCKYQSCPTHTSTIITTDTGLKVAVNLTDGQTLEQGVYTVTVTPLNGQGASFDHVDIYLDDRLVTTIKPDATGTAQWAWDTTANPAQHIKVVVTGTDGQVITESYAVQISPASTPDNTMHPASRGTSSDGGKATGMLSRFFHWMPAPLIKTFPYVLFLVLLANLALLSWQTYQEMLEYTLARQLLSRQRNAANNKRTLLGLMSHYLRTPMTVLGGGVDMLETQGPVQSDLNKLRKTLMAKVERLIAQVRESASPSDNLPVAGGVEPMARFWLRPFFSLPIVLIGAVAAVFDYLAHRAASYTMSQVNMILQALVYFTIAVLTYLVFRYLQLRRRDARELARTMAAEAAVVRAGDEAVNQVSASLSEDVTRLGALVVRLPSGEPTHYISNGYQQLATMTKKLQLAAGLRGERSDKPMVWTPLGDLTEGATMGIAEVATHHISVVPGVNPRVPVRDVELLQSVLASLLNNAVAYSAEGTTVEVASKAVGSQIQVTVTDHGQGIPADKLGELFLPFQKLEGFETFNHEGMGFSLYLDRLIMAYLGGSIQIAPAAGTGTSVVLMLPVA